MHVIGGLSLFGQIWREHAAVRALHAGNGYVHPHQSALYFRSGGGANRMWQNRSLETARRFGAGASLEQQKVCVPTWPRRPGTVAAAGAVRGGW